MDRKAAREATLTIVWTALLGVGIVAATLLGVGWVALLRTRPLLGGTVTAIVVIVAVWFALYFSEVRDRREREEHIALRAKMTPEELAEADDEDAWWGSLPSDSQ